MPHICGRPWLPVQPIPVQLVAIVGRGADSPEQPGSPQLNLRLLRLLVHHLVGPKAAVNEDPPRWTVQSSALGEAILGRDIAVGVPAEIRIAMMRNLLRRRVIRADPAQMVVVVLVVQGTQIRHGVGEEEGIGSGIAIKAARSYFVAGQASTSAIRHQPVVQGTRVSASQTEVLELQRGMGNGGSQGGTGPGPLGDLQGSSSLFRGHGAFLERGNIISLSFL